MSVSCIDLHKTLPCLRDLDRQQYAAARRTHARIPRQALQVQAQRSSKKEDHWGNGLDQKRRRDKNVCSWYRSLRGESQPLRIVSERLTSSDRGKITHTRS